MGVAWTFGQATRYVILAAYAKEAVLAHELGHYLGNPHSAVPDNVMSYERKGGELFFDEAQGRVMRRRLAEFLRAGTLVQERP
jgi:hypothetical protein